jgi:hypothetical protein
MHAALARADTTGECWTIPGLRTRPKIRIAGADRRLYQVVWEETHGPIPEGGVIHHTCENKLCVRPAHLELMASQSEHITAHLSDRHVSATCINGHAKTPDNVWRQRNGGWKCKTCHREIARRSAQRRR